jgi:hypothetical protein
LSPKLGPPTSRIEVNPRSTVSWALCAGDDPEIRGLGGSSASCRQRVGHTVKNLDVGEENLIVVGGSGSHPGLTPRSWLMPVMI